MALWQKLLAAAVRARSMSARAAPRPKPPAAPFLAGCLMRLMLFVVILFVAAAGALFLGGQALLEGWTPL